MYRRIRNVVTYPDVTGVDIFREGVVVYFLEGHPRLWQWYHIGVSILQFRAGRQLIYFRRNLRNTGELLVDCINVVIERWKPGKIQWMGRYSGLQRGHAFRRNMLFEAFIMTLTGLIQRVPLGVWLSFIYGHDFHYFTCIMLMEVMWCNLKPVVLNFWSYSSCQSNLTITFFVRCEKKFHNNDWPYNSFVNGVVHFLIKSWY